jgi:hypothetical protein
MHLPFTSSGSRKSTRKVPRGSAMGLICLVSAFSLIGCEKSPTGPEPFKDPRTYTWTIDTLAYPGSFQTTMRDIWGSSASDVYVVGHNDQNRGLMWHFDGSKWRDVALSTTQGGTIAGPIDLSAIYGFATNDIWAVGERIYTNPTPPPNFLDSSLIIHYDGVSWREVALPRQRALTNIWGSSPSDIRLGGLNGTLYHYDGLSVKKDSVPLFIPKDADPLYNFFSITGKSSDEVYLLLFAPPPKVVADHFYLFKRQSNSWVLLDSTYTYWHRIWMSPMGTLYTVGAGVYRRAGSTWQSMQLDVITSLGISGISDNNLFVVGYSGVGGISGEVYHFNGTDWFPFRSVQLRNLQYYAIWADGREAFIVGNNNQQTLVLHGR